MKPVFAVVFVLAALSTSSAMAESKAVKATGFVAVPDEGESANGSEVSSKVKAAVPSYEGLSQEEALRKAWTDELEAIKAKEQMELKAIALRQETDRRHAEVEHDITVKKRKIYEYRQKQEEYAEEVERMKAEIAEMDGKAKEFEKDVVSAGERAKLHQEKFSDVKKDLDGTKGELASSVEQLRKTRETTAKKINAYMIQMQQMRAEIAQVETEIARADNDRTRAEAEELQVRSQWAAIAAHTQEIRADRSRALAEVADLKNRLEMAKKDYLAVRAEADQAEKQKLVAVQEVARQKVQINAEMMKLETETARAVTDKANADAEKVRVAAEIEKLKTDLAYVKKRNADSQAEQSDAEGTAMESRLAFETAKADLSNELSQTETQKLRNDAVAVKLRGLASVAEQSDMVDAHKPWVAVKACAVTRTPSSTGQVGGKVSSGDRLIAAPSAGGFVKILNSSGNPAYIPASCGRFAE